MEAHWQRIVGDAVDAAPGAVFMRLWRTQYAIARNPALDLHLHDIGARVARSEDPEESAQLLEEYSRLRHEVADTEPEDRTFEPAPAHAEAPPVHNRRRLL
ncbi:hypothetical protein [Streptomyces sp. NPDC049813]|uniref:hypothetical protein n=1 Tax=Streptomyces sp. NPDC049813 TaxID=3365597 RepID=UPI0037B59BF2